MIVLTIPAKKASISVQNGEAIIGLDITANNLIHVIELAQKANVNTVTLKDITVKTDDMEELMIVNGWLDGERFAHDLTEEEQMACETVLEINIRRQKQQEGKA